MPFPLSVVRAAALTAAAVLLSTAVPQSVHAAAPRVVPLTPNWAISAVDITKTCAQQIAIAGRRIDAMVRVRSARTFDSIFATYEEIGADLGDNLAAQTALFQISPEAAVRNASQKCNDDVSAFNADESARPDVYAAMVAAAKSNTARTRDDRKLEELYLIGGKRSGAGLPPAQRTQFVALEKQLSIDESKFNANLSNDASAITITSDQAASLPPELVGNLQKDATGAYNVPVDESTYGPFMNNEADEAARKAFQIADSQRGGVVNVALLQGAIAARDRVATLLGFPNWSAYVAADRMVKTSGHISRFLSNLDTALLPSAKMQLADLAAVKGAPMNPWDVSYYETKIRKAKYSLDQEAIKQYFPAEHTIDAVLGIYAHMLGLTFTLVKDAPVWYKGVVAYDVADAASGENRGRFYLDLFPRPGKYNHFANMGPTPRRIMPDGTIRPPVNIIVGNWPAPSPGKPSLLPVAVPTQGDLLSFFHEFGHNVAALCANTPYESLNEGFRLDFIEAPSQMLENFVYDPGILKKISSNVETGQPIPDDMIAKINAARYYNEAYDTVGQVFLASVDQAYHSLAPPLDTTAVWMKLKALLTPLPAIGGTYPQAGFSHLMGGYEAGYYGYLYSKVYAQDMFTAFKGAGLENPVVGMRYRNDILAPARAEEPDQEVQTFLGRPMNPNAFYAELGIATPGK